MTPTLKITCCIILFAFMLPAPVKSQDIAPADSVRILQWIQQGQAAVTRKDTAAATRLLLQARDSAKALKLDILEARAARIAGDMFYSYEIYQRAFANYSVVRSVYVKRNEYELPFIEVSIALARTQYHRGNYRLAVNHFVDALQLARKFNNRLYEAEALENLGLLYNSFQGVNEGTAYYTHAYRIKKSLGDDKGAVRLAQILGETYYRKRMYDSAYYFSSLALADARQTALATDAQLAELNMALSLIRQKKWQEAEAILQKPGQPGPASQDENRRTRYEIAMGNFYLSQGDSARGMVYYNKVLARARTNAFPETYALAYRHMAESYYELKDYRHAYEYFTLYNGSVSQMYAGRNLSNLGSLENIMSASTSKDEVRVLNVQNEQKQSQLMEELMLRQALEKENALMDDLIEKEKTLSEVLARERQALERESSYKTQQLQNERQLRSIESDKLQNERKRKFTLLGGLLVALVLGSIIFILFRRQRRKNQIIQKQADDMQVLMKEIHHRVKNNLQIISSLLDLQSFTIKDVQASEAVKESKNRVQSMALIHQNLYSDGNIKGIRVQPYITRLVRELCDSYNISSGQVQLHTRIDDLNLDVDTMIPLGLALNELVSNALKYAFKEAGQGVLEIVLQQQGGGLLLRVSDNGAGFPPGMDVYAGTSFGLKMIRAFAQKLKARLDIYNDQGAVVEMHITKFKTA